MLWTSTLLSMRSPANFPPNLGSDTHLILIMDRNGTLKPVTIMTRYQNSMVPDPKFGGKFAGELMDNKVEVLSITLSRN